MDFFGMGIGEVLLVLIVALIIWGPEKIPEIARTLSKTVRAFRKATFDLTSAVTSELKAEEKDHSPQSKAGNDDKARESSDIGTIKPPDEEVAGEPDRQDVSDKNE